MSVRVTGRTEKVGRTGSVVFAVMAVSWASAVLPWQKLFKSLEG
jgi:hypothetical protein